MHSLYACVSDKVMVCRAGPSERMEIPTQDDSVCTYYDMA